VYAKPPVIETALGIEFAPIKGWNLIHYGGLWEHFKQRYPQVEVHPSPQEFIAQPELELKNPPVRCFFISAENDQLVQVRSGGFTRNWRAGQVDREYPRFKKIRPSFVEDLNSFMGYLDKNNMERPEIWKCEVTYVNHFLRGREWQSPTDLFRIVPSIAAPPRTEVLDRLLHTRFAALYALPGDLGQIQLQLQPGVKSDGQEISQLTITAFGKPKGSSIDQILDWIDIGHFAVVQGFSDFTSPDIQTSIWERTWPR
jgi:uncharacterized protein (TIGR04255 family)